MSTNIYAVLSINLQLTSGLHYFSLDIGECLLHGSQLASVELTNIDKYNDLISKNESAVTVPGTMKLH